MKAAIVLSFVAAAVASVVEKRGCSPGNNCARAVTGTRDGLLPITSRQSDCSSFMMDTVTPNSVVTTVTVTVDGYGDEPAKRDERLAFRAATVMPTALPAYASACTDAAEYSSICDCWGITATTTTAKAPTSTVTVTVTSDYCEDL